MKSKAIFLLIILSACLKVFADSDRIKLSYDNASWTSVMSGKAVQEPEMTSYGFVVLTDGKLLSAYSENGKQLWDYPVFTRKTNFLSVVSKDFIVLVSEQSAVSLINPSGKLLWSQNIGFPVIAKPTTGRDSRIFIQGKQQIACLGINGIVKWKIKTPVLKNMPIQTLNDGTLIAFLEGPANERTEGIRFTPFGTVIETITFAGPVSDAITTKDGILLSFLCGGLGLVGVEKKTSRGAGVSKSNEKLSEKNSEKTGEKSAEKTDSVVTKWAYPSDDSAFREALPAKGTAFVLTGENEAALILCNSAKNCKLIFFEPEKGAVINIYHVPDIHFDKLSCYSKIYGEEGVFLSDDKTALITTSKRRTIYESTLPSRQSRATGWSHVFYTGENHLVLLGNSWVLNGFRTIQKVTASGNGKSLAQSATTSQTQSAQTQKQGSQAQNQGAKSQKTNNSNKSRAAQKAQNKNAPIYEQYLKIEDRKAVLSYAQSIPKSMTDRERISKIQEGHYAEEEIEFSSDLFAACQKYIELKSTTWSGARPYDKNIFETDYSGFETIILQIPLMGTDDYPRLLSRLIKSETNVQTLTTLVKAAGLCAYDPENLMLDAIKSKLATIPVRSSTLLKNISITVYEICRFMGRPALYNYGMELQKELLSAQYPSDVREEARTNLSNIARLKM